MAVNTKPVRIKVENAYVENAYTGAKEEIVFDEQPRGRCFLAKKFCVDENGNLFKGDTARSFNHERIQLRLDWDNKPKYRDGTGNPILDADFFAYNAKTQKEKRKRLTGERSQAHHTSAKTDKSGERTYNLKYKNCRVTIKIAIEWHINIEDQMHLSENL